MTQPAPCPFCFDDHEPGPCPYANRQPNWSDFGDPASGDWPLSPPAPRRPSLWDRVVGALINAMSRRTR